jgi:hypothetical protein
MKTDESATLRETVMENYNPKDDVHRVVLDWIMKNPTNPAANKVIDRKGVLFETDRPAIITLRKDFVEKGRISRGTARPMQVKPGVLLNF